MQKSEYLLPVGAEITAASGVEAFVAFRNIGVHIVDIPLLGAVRHQDNPDNIFFVWLYMTEDNLSHIISLFSNMQIPSGKGWQFSPLRKGQMILYPQWHSYIVDYEKDIGFCVRNLNFYWHERYAIQEAAIKGCPKARFKLCRIFVTAENSRLLILCWIGYEEESNTLLFVKLFEEDYLEMAEYSYTEFGREAVDVGERIFIHGKSYILKEDENGLLYLDAAFYNPHLRIVTDNRK